MLVIGLVVTATAAAGEAAAAGPQLFAFGAMTFNILQGGGDAGNVGFGSHLFGGSRLDAIAAVIRQADADIVGVQEDYSGTELLTALGAGWRRVGSVYARVPLRKVCVKPWLTVAEATWSGGRAVTVVNCHWFPKAKSYGPDLAQAELRADPALADPAGIATRITGACAVPGGPRGYDATVAAVRDAIAAGKDVILTGDFNEPSHRDWTRRYAENGADRWVRNPTGAPLRFAVRWPGSVALEEAGLTDSFRAMHADEVAVPGWTWTPAYPDHSPGRRPYGDQVLDRIDRVYHAGPRLEASSAVVLGEVHGPGSVAFAGRWPSDHRTVVVTFELAE
jgi:endonuclease/exonuclease/phosphatase family metal-dependent hydrolase